MPDPESQPQPQPAPDETAAPPAPETPDEKSLGRWLMEDEEDEGHPAGHTDAWWRVMCLTGVDYFSTLGYQPGIAFLAAGAVAPLATLVLVLVTLFVALPIYRQVAARSPHGEGSIKMLEELLPRWRGKGFVLVLLGFALTDFIITITLSAADATAHIIENPLAPHWLDHPVLLTMLLLLGLGAVFLKGFGEAIGLAVGIVTVYLALNAVVLGVALNELLHHPELLPRWHAGLLAAHGSPWGVLAVALILFPKLALGLSGFETGVAVMPHVTGAPGDTHERPAGRIRNAQKLLITAAVIMSGFLMASSVTTTLLIPPHEFEKGGEANGRALAWLAHRYLGHGFGTVYDAATISILWFAGASAMAGLLNLVPRYLPPYGMAPDWARARRPLVLVFTLVTLLVTVVFQADVDAQGGAYATGVLALMTSAAVAVTIANWSSRWRWAYLPMTLVFLYTFLTNIHERPEGLKIASVFTVSIITLSMFSRTLRSTELRIGQVRMSGKAEAFLRELQGAEVRIIAHRPDKQTLQEYDRKEDQAREDHSLDSNEPLIFLEVLQGDASEFSDDIVVRGTRVGRHRVLRCVSPAIPNAIAALLIHLRDKTGAIPHAYFGWTEGNPLGYALRYIVLGEGDTAPLTREVLRRHIRDPHQRPRIHVG